MFLCPPPHFCVCLLPCLYRTLLTDPSANRHSDLFRTWFFCIVLLRTWDDRFLFKAVIFLSLDLDWEVRSLGRVMVLFFTFRETFIWFSIRAAPVYTSVDTEAGRLSSMLLVELVSSWCSDKGHPSKGEATPPGGFDLQNHACFHIPLVMHGFLGEKACRSFVTGLLPGMSPSDVLNITPYQGQDPRLLFTISSVAFSFCWLLPLLHRNFNSTWSHLFSFCFSAYNLHINLQRFFFHKYREIWKFIWKLKIPL